MTRLSIILTEALLECLSAPPGHVGDDVVTRSLERALRRAKRIPVVKPDTPLNIAAKKRLAAMKAT